MTSFVTNVTDRRFVNVQSDKILWYLSHASEVGLVVTSVNLHVSSVVTWFMYWKGRFTVCHTVSDLEDTFSYLSVSMKLSLLSVKYYTTLKLHECMYITQVRTQLSVSDCCRCLAQLHSSFRFNLFCYGSMRIYHQIISVRYAFRMYMHFSQWDDVSISLTVSGLHVYIDA